MYQNITFIILSMAILTQTAFIMNMSLNSQNQNLVDSENLQDLNFFQNEGRFELLNYTYTQDSVNTSQHTLDIEIMHVGAASIYDIDSFDIFSSLVNNSLDKVFLYDYWIPQGTNMSIIESGTYWDYSIYQDLINPNVWDNSEKLTITIYILSISNNTLVGDYSIGIFNSYGWGFQSVVVL